MLQFESLSCEMLEEADALWLNQRHHFQLLSPYFHYRCRTYLVADCISAGCQSRESLCEHKALFDNTISRLTPFFGLGLPAALDFVQSICQVHVTLSVCAMQ